MTHILTSFMHHSNLSVTKRRSYLQKALPSSEIPYIIGAFGDKAERPINSPSVYDSWRCLVDTPFVDERRLVAYLSSSPYSLQPSSPFPPLL